MKEYVQDANLCSGEKEAGGACTPPLERLAAFAMPHKALYISSVVLSIAAVACGFLPYVSVMMMVSGLISETADVRFCMAWLILAAVGQVGKAALSALSTLISHKATFAVLSEVRRALAAKLDRMPLGYVLETPSGKLKAPFVERVEQLEVPLAHVVPELTANLLVPLGIAVYIFVLDWRMGLASLVTIPVGAVCYAFGMRDYAEKYGRVVAAKNHMGATIVEYISGIEVIKAFGQGASSYKKFTDAVRANSDLMLDWMRATLPSTALMMNVWPAVLVGVLPIGCILTVDGSLPPATFVSIIVLALGIIEPLFTAMLYTSDISKISTIVGEIGEVLDQEEMRRPEENCAVCDNGVELVNVTFSYGEKPVLHGVDLSIAPGTMLALVGPSGSGKSTIAKLIASQWDATGGEVRIGGADVRNMPLSQVAESIAYVAQDNYLFDDTIMNNIRMGRPNATDDDVVSVARAAGCHDFIMGLDNGYQTVVGGSGGHLSGGERQRIAIARAMMKDAPIVIMDEATAYTDPENEAVIQDAVTRLARGKTLIVIAHRLSTITHADAIAVVNDGAVVACASHDELLATCPLYQKMWSAHESARDAA